MAKAGESIMSCSMQGYGLLPSDSSPQFISSGAPLMQTDLKCVVALFFQYSQQETLYPLKILAAAEKGELGCPD